MRPGVITLLVCLLPLSTSLAENQLHFDHNITALTYGDYTLTKVNLSADEFGNWRFELKQGDELLYAMGDGEVHSGYLEAALLPAIKAGVQQLALQRYTGGAHCCYFSALLQLEPEYKVLFDSAHYGNSLGYELTAVDLDGEGTLELQQTVLTFDYFYVLPHVASPMPAAIFQYDEMTGRYVPANDRFAEHVKEIMQVANARRRMEETRAAANVEQIETYHPYLTAVMTVVLALAYTGQPEAARDFLETEYALPDKTELLHAYDQKLAECAYFRELTGGNP